MMGPMPWLRHVVNEFASFKGLSEPIAGLQVEPTREGFEGDYTVVVFPLVKWMKLSPEACAADLSTYLQEKHAQRVSATQVVKGFLNVQLSPSFWFELLNQSEHYIPEAKPQVLVEYSSPNTNKPLHLGHLRNNFLGFSVARILQAAGHQVVKTQIVNDRGVHICKSMLAWQKFANGATPADSGMKGDKFVGHWYVAYDKELKRQQNELEAAGLNSEPAIATEVQQMLVDWERDKPEVKYLWNRMNSWVYAGFASTYERMGVDFDREYHESETYLLGKSIVEKALSEGKSGFFKKDDGSVWVDLSEFGLDEKLLIRANGTTVYITQDIGTAVRRFEDFPAMNRAIYTVGDEQDHHFKVLFAVLQKLGYQWASRCSHLSYGMVDLPSGKMKSREGSVVDADDLMDEVVNAAEAVAMEKGKIDELAPNERTVLYERVGLGALKFFLLRVEPRKRMLFDPAESVSLQGDTGPFIQYTYTRCRAVLRKSGNASSAINAPDMHPVERKLLRTLVNYWPLVNEAAHALSPALVANYALELAKDYNRFYHEMPILKAAPEALVFRIYLTQRSANTLAAALNLLGIEVVERM